MDNSDAVNPQLIANYFIQSVDTDSGDNITHLKLQKLMYFAQAWYLANINKVLFDEDMQAWAHGPVTPSIWHKYKENRWGSLSLDDDAVLPDKKILPFLQLIWERYGQFSPKKLEQMTHNDGPWKDVRGGRPQEARCTDAIPKQRIRDYYAKKINKNWNG